MNKEEIINSINIKVKIIKIIGLSISLAYPIYGMFSFLHRDQFIYDHPLIFVLSCMVFIFIGFKIYLDGIKLEKRLEDIVLDVQKWKQ